MGFEVPGEVSYKDTRGGRTSIGSDPVQLESRCCMFSLEHGWRRCRSLVGCVDSRSDANSGAPRTQVEGIVQLNDVISVAQRHTAT